MVADTGWAASTFETGAARGNAGLVTGGVARAGPADGPTTGAGRSGASAGATAGAERSGGSVASAGEDEYVTRAVIGVAPADLLPRP